MKYLKIFSVALVIGSGASACTSECYECTASDPNGQGTPVSDEICRNQLSSTEKTEFAAEFATQHNPAMYSISCVDK